MKTTTYVAFLARGAPWSRVRPILERAGLTDAVRAGASITGYSGEVAAGSDALAELRDAVRREFGEELTEYRVERFTHGELCRAPLLHLELALEPRESATLYDLTRGCPKCGVGAVQLSPMRINASQIKTRGHVFSTLLAETALAEDVALTAVGAGMTGFTLGHVLSKQTYDRLPWLQLRVHEELPPISRHCDVRAAEVCSECGKSGWFGPERAPLTLVYEADDVDPARLPDVTQTWERWGYGFGVDAARDSSPVLADPVVVCKPRVYELFKRLRVRNARFRPVQLRAEPPPETVRR